MKNLRKAAKQRVMGIHEATSLGLHTAVEHSGTADILKLTPALILYPYSPYDGKWSKTMVGFGPEDEHFVAELTYNYGVGEYQLGNDFLVSER